jgi:hypothetical protein
MTGGADPSLRLVKQRFGNWLRIRAKADPALPINQNAEADGLQFRLAEHRLQDVRDEFHRRLVIIVNDKLNGRGVDRNIVHENPQTQPVLERTKEEHHEMRAPSSARRLPIGHGKVRKPGSDTQAFP